MAELVTRTSADGYRNHLWKFASCLSVKCFVDLFTALPLYAFVMYPGSIGLSQDDHRDIYG